MTEIVESVARAPGLPETGHLYKAIEIPPNSSQGSIDPLVLLENSSVSGGGETGTEGNRNS